VPVASVAASQDRAIFVEGLGDLRTIDRFIVAFSAGKDSTAVLLHLLELGIPREKIELWHHAIDPHDAPFMDWPVTPAYCRAFADAFELPLLFQWKEGGFEREMLRDASATAPVLFETWATPSAMRRGDPVVVRTSRAGRAEPGTRLKFPQRSADLGVRWCSSYLKIDVAAKVFTNDPRFTSGRFVMCTGERGEESPNRARYATVEEHKSTAPSKNRHVWQWRPILRWSEQEVWNAIERWRVVSHPAYRIGFGRLSCLSCIFGGPAQWAAIAEHAPAHFERIASYEERFGLTIDRTRSVRALVAHARNLPSFVPAGLETMASRAMTATTYDEPIFLPAGRVWQLPAGAFKKTGGPS
jgi:3'-phosphoadenosine 5'-phosphosulfate sulfotransferase (PAPS reductase)/FAD synthetase